MLIETKQRINRVVQPGISLACNLEVAVSINDHSTIKQHTWASHMHHVRKKRCHDILASNFAKCMAATPSELHVCQKQDHWSSE